MLLVLNVSCSSGSGEAPDGAVSLAPILVVGRLGTRPGEFRQPRAIAVDPRDGGFYVVDRTGRVQSFTSEGELRHSWVLPDHAFGQPVGVVVDRGGTVLINDSHYQRILRFRPEGGEPIASWGTAGTGPGEFTFGRDVAVDSEGNVFAGDYGGGNDRVQKFSPEGRFLLQFGGRGTEPGKFDRPQGMAVERRVEGEYLLVADCSNHRIQRFDLEGRFVSAWGSLGTEPGSLRYPSSVAVAGDGTIFVSEWGNNRIQRFTADGRTLGVWGRAGREVGELATPWDVAVGVENRVLVVDYGNHRIQVLDWPADLVACFLPHDTSREVPHEGSGRGERP